jgi:hypothetical protein
VPAVVLDAPPLDWPELSPVQLLATQTGALAFAGTSPANVCATEPEPT